MKKPRVLTVLGVLLVLAVAFVPARVSAAVDSFKFKGAYADAYFTSIDSSDPCIVISAYVYAADGRIKESGSKSEIVSEVSIILYRYNNCTNEQIINAPGSAQVSAEAFQVDEQLNLATLNTTLDVCDFITGNCFPASISLTWTGTGEVIEGKNKSFEPTVGGCKYHFKSKGSYREAMTTGGITALGTSFTPEQAESAQIADVKNGSALINCE